MRLAIVGGALQGTEAAYLARKASIETVVIDRWPVAPALSMADEAHILDVTQDPARALRIFETCDAVIPANEDRETLMFLKGLFRRTTVPFIHDFEAYEIGQSKIRSELFMKEMGIPTPMPWPDCGFPAIVKPSGYFGNKGVSRVNRKEQMVAAVAKAREADEEVVIQEFVDGPSISIDVISNRALPVIPMVTEIVPDGAYECKMVMAPFQDNNLDASQFGNMGKRIAERLELKGIMNVRAILTHGAPKVLGFEAGLPSQTPSAILHASGINIISLLMDVFVEGGTPEMRPIKDMVACYEHLIFERGVLSSMGKGNILREDSIGPLRIEEDWFGFDEAITDFQPGKKRWVATVMSSGKDKVEVQRRRRRNIEHLMVRCGISEHYNSKPSRATK